MSEKSDLKDKIKSKKEKISDLNKKKEKYEKLKSILEDDVLPELKNSSTNISTAQTTLKSALVSTLSTKQQSKVSKVIDGVDRMRQNIAGKIIPKIKEEIKQIKGKIKELKEDIKELKDKLDELKDDD